jgi:hypothetical protein
MNAECGRPFEGSHMSIVQSARNRIFRLAVEFTASVLTIALADLCASSPVLLRATLSAGQEIRDLSRNSGNVKLRSVRVVLGSSVFSMVIRRVHDRFLPDAINHFIQCQVHGTPPFWKKMNYIPAMCSRLEVATIRFSLYREPC